MSWSLSSGYFPREYPDLPAGVYWTLAATTAVLFGASVLAHELAHCWVSLRSGLRVRGIRLFIFGGAAEIAQGPRSPGVEFRIAAAGPLTSLLLAGAFWLLYQLDRQLPLLAAPSEWLARTNLILALFNLVPGLPLDGGRMLRALVWRGTGSFQRATAVAAGAGHLAAYGLMGLGVFTMVSGSFLNGLWLLFIGWFLQSAATASYAQSTLQEAQTTLQEALRGVTAARIMDTTRPQASADLTLHDLVEEHVLTSGSRYFFVTDEDGTVRGLVTLKNVTAVPRADWRQVTLAEVMIPTERVLRVEAQTELLDALQIMDDAGVAQLPVMDGGAVLGVLTREGVLHYVRTRTEIGPTAGRR